MDSVFNLQRPYDLMALLKQEERAEMLENLKHELLSRKGDFDGNEDKDSGVSPFTDLLFVAMMYVWSKNKKILDNL